MKVSYKFMAKQLSTLFYLYLTAVLVREIFAVVEDHVVPLPIIDGEEGNPDSGNDGLLGD
jgi:hypothetical protein